MSYLETQKQENEKTNKFAPECKTSTEHAFIKRPEKLNARAQNWGRFLGRKNQMFT